MQKIFASGNKNNTYGKSEILDTKNTKTFFSMLSKKKLQYNSMLPKITKFPKTWKINELKQ